uniref:Protein phosphatase 1 regulatory subunit 15A n=1 Tax=Canis lupus familiaris TaxID=9615 RepID=A0A8C0RJS6_CANLF
MAPGQVPHQSAPWRDTYPFFLLSPLMGLLSRAWSHLRGPGSPEPWPWEAVTKTDRGKPGLEREAKTFLVPHHPLWGRHFEEEIGDSGASDENGEAFWGARHNLKANSSSLKAGGLSDNEDEEYGGEQAATKPHRTLLRRNLRKEELQKTKWSCSSLFLHHTGSVVQGEEKEEGEAINKEASRTPIFPLSPRSKPKTRVYCPREEEDKAIEEERTEDKEATKSSISSSFSGFCPGAWECCSGEEWEEEEDEFSDSGAAEEEGEAEVLSSIPSTSALMRAWVYWPGEESEEEDEDSDSGAEGEAEGPSSIPSTSALVRAWVYRPGEDSEEEDEDSDSGAAEEEGEAEGPSSIPSTSALVRAWVYRPGEDSEEEDEDSDSGAAEEEGEAEGPSSIPSTSALVRAWVYCPGEDSEEEDDGDSGAAEEEGEAYDPSSIPSTSALVRAWVYRPGEDTEEDDDSEAVNSEPSPSLQAQSTLLRGWTYQPGEDTERGGEAEPCPFRVAIYLPGEKPPPPWAPPRLPLRLQRRLKPPETPTRHPDPETPLTARKVRFSEKVSVHLLAVWAGPAQAARRGPWEQLARDRSRFARRIAQAQEQLGPCLTPAARARAWARCGNPTPPLATTPAPAQTLPVSSIQTTPLSHVGASPSIPVSLSPGLDLSGRRG